MFTQIKKDISALPMLVSPPPEAPLLVYLVVAQSAISSILVYEEGRKQSPIYFMSRILQPAEERYQIIEKLVLALIFSTRRLCHYFHSYNTTIKTDYPIKQVLQKPEIVGRMTAWATELSEFGLRYKSQDPIKAQFLADYLTGLPPVAREKTFWLLSVDGSSNKKGSDVGIILEELGDKIIE